MQNFDQLMANTNLRKALDALDGAALQSEIIILSEALTTVRRFEQYRDSLQFVKACFDERTSDAESDFVAFAKIASRAAERYVSAIKRVEGLFSAAGISDFLSAHAATLYWQFPYNPTFGPPLVNLVERLGITESEILREHPIYGSPDWDWDLLRIHGNDGTFRGFVAHVESSVRHFQDRIRRGGIPDIEGGDPVSAAIAFIFIVGIIITVGICLVGHNCSAGATYDGGTTE
jgi:hypothetical protein